MKNNLPLGSVIALICALLYSIQAALVKAWASVLPSLSMLIFIQSAVAFGLLLLTFIPKGPQHFMRLLKTNNVKRHFFRALSSLSLSYLLFYSVKFIPLVNAILLVNTSPLLLPFIAYFFMRQPINHRLWIPMVIGFIGVTIVLQPDARIFNWASLLDLAGAMCMALSMLIIRQISATDSSDTTTFYFLFFATIVSGVAALPGWQAITPTMWIPLLTIGSLYFFVQATTTLALKYINAQLVTTLFYSNIIFAAALSFLLWGTLPPSVTWFGMVFIITGGVWCIRIERQRHKQTPPVREVKYAI